MSFISVNGQSGFASDSAVFARFKSAGSYVVFDAHMELLVSVKPDNDAEGIAIAEDVCDQIFSTKTGGKNLIRLPEGSFVDRDYVGGISVANGSSVVIKAKDGNGYIFWLDTPSAKNAEAICTELIKLMATHGKKRLDEIDWDGLLQDIPETAEV
mgnify:CR=1 FL=1